MAIQIILSFLTIGFMSIKWQNSGSRPFKSLDEKSENSG
ncbi:hypothetical protein XBO1_2030034 [Xenorhabdus bovienii str. oregonense]|uniref:Uncharacterized protein n=1 Tax=Xenorhabdus bovienii str. oregonense TaxID=1398202 RepID=A0A077P7T4_XENBV|nr:hypothetical protein XBO1_2030034 [Xenorhabdus bovienii str. oregonense]